MFALDVSSNRLAGAVRRFADALPLKLKLKPPDIATLL
jgi:hypothetical protein